MHLKKLVSLAIAICAGTATAAPTFAQTVSIGSNPQGSLFYTTATTISALMSEKTGSQYRVAPFGGSSTYLPMVNRGELEFGLTNSAEGAFAYLGTEIFDGSQNSDLRQVAALFPVVNGWMVRADSDIETVADLEGRRVASEFTAGRTFHYIAGAALAASGLSWDDVVRMPVPSYVAGVDMLIEGRLDAAYSTVGVAAAQKAMASIDGGIRFVPIDASGEVRARLQSVMPTAQHVQLRPGDINNGIVEDPTDLVQMQFVLLASASTTEDEVYAVTKMLYESKPELAASLGAFNSFDPEQMMAETPIPYHEGALRFYREIGLVE